MIEEPHGDPKIRKIISDSASTSTSSGEESKRDYTPIGRSFRNKSTRTSSGNYQENEYFLKRLFTHRGRLAINIEGNIGSGITTLTKNLSNLIERQKLSVLTLNEPLEGWTNVNGENLLAKSYADQKNWLPTFQSSVMLSMIKNHLKSTQTNISIMERSIHSARYCFIENHYHNNRINPTDYEILKQWYDFLIREFRTQSSITIYIRTSPEVAFRRIRDRRRNGEEYITYGYLRQLHDLHDEWLIRGRFPHTGHLIIINGNQPKKQVLNELNEKLGAYFDFDRLSKKL